MKKSLLRQKLPFTLFIVMSLVACPGRVAEYQDVAARFIQTYYLQIDPKQALAYARGSAAEKLEREVGLLAGMSPAAASERPEMTYKILSCETPEPDLARCGYELKIQDVQSRTRHGQLTLHRMDGHWWVTQFVEAEYHDS